MEPKREPKWRPKASQDETKKEKKSEVKLRALGSFRREKKKLREFRPVCSEVAGGVRGDNIDPKSDLGLPAKAQEQPKIANMAPKSGPKMA